MSDKASEHEAWVEGAMSDVSFGHDSAGRDCRGAAIPVGVIRQYLSTLSTYNEETHCVLPIESCALCDDTGERKNAGKWQITRCPCMRLPTSRASINKALIDTADTKPITEKGDEG